VECSTQLLILAMQMNVLCTLPAELVDIALEYVGREGRTQVLHALALTSRALNAYAVSRLYESVTIGALNALLLHPHLARCVREARIELPVKDEFHFDLGASDDGSSSGKGDPEEDATQRASTDGTWSPFLDAYDDMENGFPRKPAVPLPDGFPTENQIAVFGLDDALLHALHGDSHVARAILLLHLVPSLRTLALGHLSSYSVFNALFPFPGAEPSEMPRLPAGLQSVRSMRVLFSPEAPYPHARTELLLRMMTLPKLNALYAHDLQDSGHVPTEWQTRLRAAYGTSSVQRLQLTASFLADATLEHFLYLPRTLTTFALELHAYSCREPGPLDLIMLNDALANHRETLEQVDLDDIGVWENSAELVTKRLAGFTSFPALKRLKVPASWFYTRAHQREPSMLGRLVETPLVTFMPPGLHRLELDRVWRDDSNEVDGADSTNDDPTEVDAVEDLLTVIQKLLPQHLVVVHFRNERNIARMRQACEDAGVHFSAPGLLQRSE
jgi:hypothetical protein